MKLTLATLLLIFLCAPGMAQTKGKPVLPQAGSTTGSTSLSNIRLLPASPQAGGSTGTSTLLQSATTGDDLWSKVSTGTLVITAPPAPISIDGETTDCTTPHLIKALKIAATMIADPNQSPCTECATWVYLNSPTYTNQKPSDEKRALAERLKSEANRLEAESKRVQWVRAVLAGCEQ